LVLAVTADAVATVGGDEDLPMLNPWRKIQVLWQK
jgi:hypothetical protein